MYHEPETCIIEDMEVPMDCEGILNIQPETFSIIHLSLKHSLKKLLESNGLFEATLSYMHYLENEDTVLQNFIQGDLWKQIHANFNKKGVVVPLFGYYDDVETGNALGSHASINAVGTVYNIISCLPPTFQSSLQSIIMSDIFYTKDRKRYGTEIVFKQYISELIELEENGIEITVNDTKHRVYFLTSLILGDNLGLNSIFGFTESFAATHSKI